MYCVSDYKGDPENVISERKDSIAGLLKTERDKSFDEEEINTTLKFNIKYFEGRYNNCGLGWGIRI